jgi:hypothetical protein
VFENAVFRARGAEEMSFRRRAAALARIATLLSAVWTALVATYVLGWQATALARTGEWIPFPLWRVFALAAFEEPMVYVTASVPRPGNSPSLLSSVAGWLLELPASGVLLFGAAIMLAVSGSLGTLEARLELGGE